MSKLALVIRWQSEPGPGNAIDIYSLIKVGSTILMVPMDHWFNFGTGLIILVLIVLANFYQFKVRRRFSGVIGKVMFWYSLGLGTLLVLTILEWIIFSIDMDLTFITFVERLFFIVAIACFLKGATVIR